MLSSPGQREFGCSLCPRAQHPEAPSGAWRKQTENAAPSAQRVQQGFSTNLPCTLRAAEVPEPHHRAHGKKSSWAGRDSGQS